jgi:glycosyltransferase involved in cell wall biosynthesis
MKPLVSVVICTFNRCKDLPHVLDSLLEQKGVDFNYEVIIGDNHSSDDTKEVVINYAPLFGSKLKYVYEPRQGKSFALNKTIEAARGNFICFTDDDVVIDRWWLSKIVDCFNRYHCDGVGGRVLPVFPTGTASWIKENANKLSGAVVVYDYGETTFRFTANSFPFIGANFAFKKEVFKQLGSFRTDLGGGTGTVGEDTEFINRLLGHGKSLYYCGEALVWHPFDSKRLTLRNVARWNISLGKFATRMEAQKGSRFIYYLGVPRYLIRGTIEDFFKLIVSSWNKIAFYIAWRNLFRKVGMIQEYSKSNHKREVHHAQS